MQNKAKPKTATISVRGHDVGNNEGQIRHAGLAKCKTKANRKSAMISMQGC
jgi:hypothetical protein